MFRPASPSSNRPRGRRRSRSGCRRSGRDRPRFGESNRRNWARALPVWCATSAPLKTWLRTRSSLRSNSGRIRVFPVNPGAWLVAVAKRRAIDGFRREELRERKQEEFGLALRVRADESTAPFDAALEDEISDDLLRLRRRGSSPWLAVCLSRSTSCRSRSAPKSHLRPIGICRPIRLREAVVYGTPRWRLYQAPRA